MQFEEMGNKAGKSLMLLPGTACDWQTNFGSVISSLAEKYHLICVNYDGFDGTDAVFSDMETMTEKIEDYIRKNYAGHLDGALGSSLGSTFVGQLVMREKIHIDHAIFGSPDLDQQGIFLAKLQSLFVVPLLTSCIKNEKKRKKTKEKLMNFFRMDEENAEKFLTCFSKFKAESIKNEYYSDLLTYLKEDISVEHTIPHFIYANQMGVKYRKRYQKYFHNPDIREFAMQHEQWLFGGERYAKPVLSAIDEFMETEV